MEELIQCLGVDISTREDSMGKSPLVEEQQTVLSTEVHTADTIKDAAGPAVGADADRFVTCVLSACKHLIFEVVTLRCVTKLDVTLLFAWILVPQALQLDSILPFSPSNTILK